MTGFQNIMILGGGGFGTALACVAARAGRSVHIWVRNPAIAQEINRLHTNSVYLPGALLPDSISATLDPASAREADAVLAVTPAQSVRQTLGLFAPWLRPDAPLLICAKGVETGTNMLMHQIAADIAPAHPFAVLSGPSFAADIMQGLPTAVTLACAGRQTGIDLVQTLGTQSFRPYLSQDVIGVEIGGALKNVIAIACGITEGRGLGESARAALMTRGLTEMTRLAVKLGGQAQTLMGLSGLGDLALSCNSRQSRNFNLGLRLGQGESLAQILASAKGVLEGASTAGAAVQLAAQAGVEMPICAAVDAILNQGAAIDTVILELLARPVTSESS
ncbi:MAG: NAD(P)H-dependent glycerol-3-phosphate dehydrogenase [Pseudomonadota bacterium]